MYRDMTPEEKLDYSAEIIEAIKKGGLLASLEIADKYKKILTKDTIIEQNPPQINNETMINDIENVTHIEQILKKSEMISPLNEASIYASEHISAVQEDLREQNIGIISEKKEVEQPKTKVLEVTKSTAPNPWKDAQVVSPGQLKL